MPQKPKTEMGKVKKSLITTFVVIGLYIFALFLPNIKSIIALVLGVATFLLSLYFDRDYRFYRIATVALFMIGLQRIIPHISDLNLQINPSSILLEFNNKESNTTMSDLPLALIVIVSIVLDFLRGKKKLLLNESIVKLLLLGMVAIVFVLSVPSRLLSNININSDNQDFHINIETGGIANFNNESSDKKYLKNLVDLLQEKIKRLESSLTSSRRKQLEKEITVLQTRLFDTEKTLKEVQQLRIDSLVVIERLNAENPSQQLQQAKRELLRSGDITLAQQAFDRIEKTGLGSIAQAIFQNGRIAEEKVDYDKAIKKYKKALILDEDNPEYLFVAGKMATTIADYDVAQEWLEHLLNIREKEKKNNIELAEALHETASLYELQDKYEKAEALYKRSLKIKEKILGREHPSVATTLNNIAALYVSEGKYEKAEPLYQRSLMITENRLGNNHLKVATILNNLAVLYRLQGKYEKVKPLYQRSLMIIEKRLGTDHLRIAKTLNNFAMLYLVQGKYEKAKFLFQRSIKIKKKILGSNNPSVATTLNNLAGLYELQGNYKEAELLYQQDLKIMEKIQGTDHSSVAMTLNNLAGLYKSQGKYEKAERLYTRALIIFEKVLPSEHPYIDKLKENHDDLKEKMAERK